MTQPEYPVATVIRLAAAATDAPTMRADPLRRVDAVDPEEPAGSVGWVLDGTSADIPYDLW